MTQASRTTESTDAASAVLVQRLADHVALVTLNRPQARNAVNGAVANGLQAAVDQTEADPDIWVVVLTGAGADVFCAGADLKEVSAGRSAALRTERGGFAGFVYGQRAKPWIAAVNGLALAGGCEIALACDMIVAADHAAFGLPEVLRGLMAAAGGVFRLPRALPPKIAIELILTAGRIDALRARDFGLVNAVVPRAQVVAQALELAQRITKNAPVAVRESLRIARCANDLSEAELRAMVDDGMTRVAASADYKEGPLAFIEKREPRWTGR